MSTPEERAKRAAYMRDWTRRNRERLLAKGRERYRTDHQFRQALMGRARMTKLRERGGFCKDSQDYVLALLQDPCAYCGKQTVVSGCKGPDAATIDHIIASDDSHWSNLTACCSSCNGRKGEMSLLHTMLERRLRTEMLPAAEQIFLIKGFAGERRRLEF